MVVVFYSHLGEDELKNIENGKEDYDFEGRIIDLIEIINLEHSGFRNLIFNHVNDFFPFVKIYKNIEFNESKILDGDNTSIIKTPDEKLLKSDNVLFSIYNPRKIRNLLENTILEPKLKMDYNDPKRLEPLPLEFKTFIDNIRRTYRRENKDF